MLAKIRFVFLYWLIWILIFEISRFLFIMYNFQYSRSFETGILLRTFYHGFRMDASMASYLILPICVFLLLALFIKAFSRTVIYKMYTAIILLPVLLIIFCDFPAYRAWGSRLDATPLKYLSSPREAWASVSNLPVFWLFLFFLVIYLLLYQFFRRFINNNSDALSNDNKKWVQLIVMLIFSALQIIPLRGGFQLAPLNQSSVYFSRDNFINLASINVTWNFMHSLNQHAESAKNPFAYTDKKLAASIKDSLLVQTGETQKIVKIDKATPPNIIVIVWESFTEKATHISKDGHEVTPGFNELKKEGIYFSNIFCSGDRTDKGIVAVLSGYPAQPIASIIKNPRKSALLPTLPRYYLDKKYHTSFYYGGELEFANMKSYLLGCGFDHFSSKDDFASKDQNSKWGAHDHVVKNKILDDLFKAPSPFFITWLTLSSHEPFETPVSTVIDGKDDESLFLNSLHYSDSTIADFIQKCKQQPWWDNTVIIITADHGHRLPATGKQVDDFRIPVLWLGGALLKKGITDSITGSQIDIAATLVNQTNAPPFPFKWSKDLLRSGTKEWAYFSAYNFFGFVQPDRYYIFDNIGKMIMEQHGNITETDIRIGKAIEQESYQDYLDK